jgi:hypothetical protein
MNFETDSKSPQKKVDAPPPFRIVLTSRYQHANTPHARGLLGARRDWPCAGSAAD